MTRAIDELETAFVEAMAHFAKEVGIVGATEGRLLGRLILAGKPQTQEELMARTGASRGNVSTALRALADAGFIRKRRLAGSRKEEYESRTDLWGVTVGFVLAHIRRQLETLRVEFGTIRAEAAAAKHSGLTAPARHKAAHLADRLETLLSYTDGAAKLLDAVRRLVDREPR